jgi:hypothetical protein
VITTKKQWPGWVGALVLVALLVYQPALVLHMADTLAQLVAVAAHNAASVASHMQTTHQATAHVAAHVRPTRRPK